jgi:hypothetical protein
MTRARRPRGLSANYADEQERLQEILDDKSTLVVRMLDRSNWVKSDCRPNCFYCDSKFRPFSIKRHCRACGEVVCSSCYRRRKVRKGLDAPVATVPLCFDCIDKAMISASKQEGNACDDTVLDKRDNGDSIKTTSTGESFCSRFSALSAASGNSLENSSSECGESSASDASEDDDVPKAHHNPDRQIEFMTEKEQFEIYEARRRELLDMYNVKNPGSEKEYEALCELASRALGATVAAVGFIDEKSQWYKAKIGISQPELPREIAFCSQLLQTPLPTIILDVTKDARFRSNPLVTGSAHIRFYATSPICDPDSGIIIGSVFVMDPKPKSKMPQRAVEVLSYVATAAERLLTDLSRRRQDSMKMKRHSSPSMSMRSSASSHRSDIRAGSLMSVPEEIDGPEFHLHASSSSSSSSLSSSHGSTKSESRSRGKSHGTQLQLLDPKLVLSSSTGSIKSKPAAKDASPQRRNTDAGVVAPNALAKPNVTKNTDLTCSEFGPPAAPNGPTMASLDNSCFELFYRITTTQQMLVQQQSTLLATLNQHATRIGSIEETVGRIEDMVLTLQRTQSTPELLIESKRDPSVDLAAA